jgi:hypothetical protein
VTGVPTGAVVGENKVMLTELTEKSVGLEAVPFGVVTLILPVVAPFGTVVLIWESDAKLKLADVPLKATTVAPVNADPEMVTFVP